MKKQEPQGIEALANLIKDDTDLNIKQSEQFLESATSVIKRCDYVSNIFKLQSKKIIFLIAQLAQKVQSIIGSFQQKLEGYLSCQNQRAAFKEQETFVNVNQTILNEIRDQVDSYRKYIMKFSITQNFLVKTQMRKIQNREEKGSIEEEIQKIPKKSVKASFKDLKLIPIEQFKEPLISVSGQFICVTQESSKISQIYKFQNDYSLKLVNEVKFEVRLFISYKEDHFILNNSCYEAHSVGLSLIGNILNNLMEVDRIRSVIPSKNYVLFCSSIHTHINLWNMDPTIQAKRLACPHKKFCFQNFDGIYNIQQIQGKPDTFIYLCFEKIYKCQVNQQEMSQTSISINTRIGQPKFANFLLLPDNFHLIAITKKLELMIIDHYTGEVIKFIDSNLPHPQFGIYLHPRFNLEKFPIVLLSDKKSTQIVDCTQSGLHISEKSLDVKIYEQIGTKCIICIKNGKYIIQQYQ